MNKFVGLTFVVFFVQLGGVAQAGTLSNGEWKTSHCGQKPTPPQIDVRDIDQYNKSIAAVNEWQQQSGIYFECQVKEANEDNKVIAEKANAEQAYYRKSLEAISTTLEAGKNKLQ